MLSRARFAVHALQLVCCVIDHQLLELLWYCLMCVESGLFGVSLGVLLEHDQKKSPQLRVPLILNEVIVVRCFLRFCLQVEDNFYGNIDLGV